MKRTNRNSGFAIIVLCGALILLVALCGCTTTNVSTPFWSLKRTSFMQKHQIPTLTIATNGTATMRGYSNDGGTEAAATIAGAIAEGAVRGAKP